MQAQRRLQTIRLLLALALALPVLREALDTKDAPLKERIEKSIEEIEQAEDRAEAQREHDVALKVISEFRDAVYAEADMIDKQAK